MSGERWQRESCALLLVWIVFLCPRVALAQEIEPRSLTNVPVGMNFAAIGYAYSTGEILLDPAVPIEGLNARLHTFVGAYVRSFVGAYVRSIDLFGWSGKVDVVVPVGTGDWEGVVAGVDSTTARDGFGDPRVRIAVNFVGAPALRSADYGEYRQHTIVGASLRVIAPLGQYDPSKLINLGSNRWTFRPQVGASRAAGDWILEAYTSVWLFTKNSDFFGGNEVTQAPLVDVNFHAIYTMPKRRTWLALGGAYAVGGRTKINGVKKDTRISTFQFGATLALPLSPRQTVKLTGLTGVRHQRGADFDAIALTFDFRWGGT